MCGIIVLIGDDDGVLDAQSTRTKMAAGHRRGPEQSDYSKVHDNIVMGFHRLAINGFEDDTAMQPLELDQCVLVCNGEIYNWKELYAAVGITPKTGSDCEVILHLYRKFGIEYTLQLIEGVYAFVLLDKSSGALFIARDTFGVRPLFISYPADGSLRCIIASEMKSIVEFPSTAGCIAQLEPGTFLSIDCKSGDGMSTVHSAANSVVNKAIGTEGEACETIRKALIDSIGKRATNTDRPIACLLSGGLDSSLVSALVAKEYGADKLHTWSIGLKGSEDLRYAKLVADHIGSQHHSIELSESEFLGAIDEVIFAIESYDTTTVRASVGNWLVSKYIKEQSDAKVIFNGDGSDEVCGGYLYFHCAPNEYEFDKECRRLLRDIHLFDVLRSDRSISYHGLEARTPFLDRNFVQTYLSIPPALRFHGKEGNCEKYLLRKAFADSDLLPNKVLWRTKEAFSDGVSKVSRSWFTIIQEYALEKIKDMGFAESNPAKAEEVYYRAVFERYFNGNAGVIPYKWMPRFVEASDASARTLAIYEKCSHAE